MVPGPLTGQQGELNLWDSTAEDHGFFILGMKNRKTRAAGLSIASNSVLIAVKLAVGLLTGSVAILSEAAHSAIDLLAALMAFVSVRVSDVPADEDHPFGHGKIENISGTVEAILILAVAVYIGCEAALRLLEPQPVRLIGLGIGLMAFSCMINTVVSSWLFKIAHQEDSIALEADAQHLRVDVWTSASVMVGLAAIAALAPFIGAANAARLDPIIALAVALQILRIGVKLTQEAGAPLMDNRLPRDEVSKLNDILLSDPRVVGYHKLRTRKAGPQRHIDVHLIVPENLSVAEAHAVAEDVEDQIRDSFGPAHVITHVEPGTEENLSVEDTMCREPDHGRKQNRRSNHG